MPATGVKTAWVGGNLVFYDKAGAEILTIDGANRKVSMPAAAEFTVGAVSIIDELQALSGLDSTELGYLNGVTAGTVTASKAAVVGANKNLDVLAVADLKLGAGAGTSVTATATEINVLAGVTVGTATASKAAVLDANKDLDAAALRSRVLGAGNNYKLARGVAAVTGTATVATGLTTVVAVVATAQDDLDGDTLAGVSATIGDQSGAPAAGSVYLKAWKNNADGDATMVAAGVAKNINWVAIGT